MCRSPSSSAMTRSFSVMIPTQRPASLTTGTPCSSCSPSSRATSSAFVSAVTVAGSSSMYSRTVGIDLTLPTEGCGDGVDHVADDHVVGAADPLCGLDTRTRVDERARGGGGLRVEALREQPADDPAQHVPGAGRGEG